MPVTSAIARAAYELSPATRASTQKNWSAVMRTTEPPGHRVGRAVDRRDIGTQEQRRLRDDLGLESARRDDRDLFDPGPSRESGSRVDQVMQLAPPALAHATGRC